MFLTGGHAWRACRTGDINADALAHGNEAAGLWFVLVNLVRDHLALNDCLTSRWDEWRTAASDLPVLDTAILAAADDLAAGSAIPIILRTPWWLSP